MHDSIVTVIRRRVAAWRLGGHGIPCWRERSVTEKLKERMLDISGKSAVSTLLPPLGSTLGSCAIHACRFCRISHTVARLVGSDLSSFLV